MEQKLIASQLRYQAYWGCLLILQLEIYFIESLLQEILNILK